MGRTRGSNLAAPLLLCAWILWYAPGAQYDIARGGRIPPVQPARAIEPFESRKACEAARLQFVIDQKLQNPNEAQCWPAGHRP